MPFYENIGIFGICFRLFLLAPRVRFSRRPDIQIMARGVYKSEGKIRLLQRGHVIISGPRCLYLENIAFILPHEVGEMSVGTPKAPISVPAGKPLSMQGLPGSK